MACKLLGVSLLLHLRFFRRPVGRPISFDLALLYFGTYSILGSNIPGVYLKWHLYSDSVQTLLESEKLRRRGLRNTQEFLNYCSLPDHRCVYYKTDMQFARFY